MMENKVKVVDSGTESLPEGQTFGFRNIDIAEMKKIKALGASCCTCRYMREITGNSGYCEYPLPAWVHLALGHGENRMPLQYAPCDCYDPES